MPAPVQFGSQIVVTNATGNQYFPHVAAFETGRVVVGYNTANAANLAIFRTDGVSASSQGSSSNPTAIATVTQGQIDLAVGPGGRLGIVYQDNGTDAAGEIVYRTYVYADGALTSGAAIPIVLAGAQAYPSIAMSQTGHVVLAYETVGTGTDIHRASFSPFNLAFFSSAEITSGAGNVTGEQVRPDLALLSSGNTVAVWLDLADGTIRGTFMDSGGGRFGTALNLASGATFNSDQDSNPSVSALADGGFVIAFYGASGATNARVFNSDGTPRSATNPLTALNNIEGGAAYTPKVLGLADGRFVVVTGGFDIWGQVFNADGTESSAPFAIANTANSENQLDLALLPDGRFVVTYSANGVAGGDQRDIVMSIWDPREAGVVVSGSGDNDEYIGSAFGDTFSMGVGDDRVDGAGGDDSLNGGAGTDTLLGGEGNDTLNGGVGADALNGGNGLDTASYANAGQGVYVYFGDLANATGEARGDTFTSVEKVIGTNFNDIIGWGEDDNVISGLAGNDQLFGNGGADILIGGAGADVLNGGAGADIASYEGSNAGVRVVFGDLGTATGDAIGDSFVSIEGLTGTEYSDVLSLDGGDNALRGLGGNDQLFGQGGNDFLAGGSGQDILNGGDGIDTAFYAETAVSRIYYLFGDVGNAQGDALGDVYISIENINGTLFNDIVGIGDGDNVVRGLDGNDWLFGQGGNDVLDGGTGADILEGGAGTDTASYANAASGVYVFFGDLGSATGEAAGDTFISIENLTGSAFNDILGWDDNNNTINGGAGADTLYGQGGNDILIGGAGNDTLTGGAGVDNFLYNTTLFGADTITDFQDGVEVIDFRGSGLTFANLTISPTAGGVLVTTTDGSSINIAGLTVGQITSADFVFGP